MRRYTKEEADSTLARLEELATRKEFNPEQLEALHDFTKFWRAIMSLRYGFKAIVAGLSLVAAGVAAVLYLIDKAKGIGS